jgi:hypothetical protein
MRITEALVEVAAPGDKPDALIDAVLPEQNSGTGKSENLNPLVGFEKGLLFMSRAQFAVMSISVALALRARGGESLDGPGDLDGSNEAIVSGEGLYDQAGTEDASWDDWITPDSTVPGPAPEADFSAHAAGDSEWWRDARSAFDNTSEFADYPRDKDNFWRRFVYENFSGPNAQSGAQAGADAGAETAGATADEEIPPQGEWGSDWSEPEAVRYTNPVSEGRFNVPPSSRQPNEADLAASKLASDLYTDSLKDAGWDGVSPITKKQEALAFKTTLGKLHPEAGGDLTAEREAALRLITGARRTWKAGLTDDK